MNHRQRALAALRHEEPDRVPIDFGGTVDSTISALSYQELRAALGLTRTVTRIQDVTSCIALVDDDVREILGVDTTLVADLPLQWRRSRLRNGLPADVPYRFRPERQADGSDVVFDAGGNIVLRMPADGFYFDPVYAPLADATSPGDIDKCLDQIDGYDQPSHLDLGYEGLGRIARSLHEDTDYLVIGYFGGHIFQAAQSLRGWETFLVDLLDNRSFADALMVRITESNLRRFERFARFVGPWVDVVQFEDDLGMQDRPLLPPDLYRQVVKPHQARLFHHAREHCQARLLLHSDGAVAPFIPDFIEMGVDALNPVQVSAAGMDTRSLKRAYGKEITFWGGGCDSQSVLPFGTPQQVADEVKRRIDDLAPGGGFIFSPIHNVQAGMPVANVLAMFQTALEYGASGNR
jgi:uroporphyrinogen decarboxylase